MQLLRAGEFAIDCRNPAPSPALQLIARTRLRLFVSSALCSRLDRCIVGDQAVIDGESLSDHLPSVADFRVAADSSESPPNENEVQERINSNATL